MSLSSPFFFLAGPNPAGPSGTVPHAVETQVTYIAKMLRKMSSQRIKSMAPLKAAADDFVQYAQERDMGDSLWWLSTDDRITHRYCDAFFPRTNLSLKCSSWSNGGKAGNR